MIRSYRGVTPQFASSAFVEDSAQVIGDVVIGEDSSVWFNTVIRGDVNYIRIGARTNLQDGSVLHVFKDHYPLVIGDDVTVGHGCVLHGCTIENRCLISMGAVVLNGARIGAGSIVAAGAVVTENTIVPPRSLFLGMPAKFFRHLTDEDQKVIDQYAARYVEYKEVYLSERRK